MVTEAGNFCRICASSTVLILIVLDYGHWGVFNKYFVMTTTVLILIVLDYGHWGMTIIQQT